MKKIISLFLCLCLLLPIIAGCEISFAPKQEIPANGNQIENEKPGGDNGTTPTNSPNGIDLSDPIDEDGINWATYDWNNYNPADLFVSLGNATFTVDNSATATGEFTPGETLSLSVTDGAGAKWTLEIPAGALLFPETVTMTILRDVQLGGDDMDGGVLLSPDGLQFMIPAALTVTGNGCDEDSVILEGGHDGKNMTFTEYETGDGSVSTTIEHFSIRTKARGKYGASVSMLELLIDMGNEILRRPLEAPEPPSLTFKCPEYHNTDSGSKNKAIMDFMLKCGDPELVARRTIKNAIANYRGKDAIVAQAMDVVMKLEQRFADKINMLIYRYKYQEDKLAAIFTLAVYGTWNKDGTYGIDYEEIYKWVAEAWNELMRELVEDHDYTRAHSLTNLITVVKSVYALRDIGLDTDAAYRRLSNALTFRVEWELEEHVFFTICSKGETEVSMNQISGDDYFGEATGEGHLASFTDPDSAVYVTAFPSFGNKAQLSNLDPCRNKAITVAVDKFGTDFTAYADTDMGPMPIPFTDYPKPIIHYVDGNAVLTTGFFTFKLDLINLSEKCADSSITAQQEELSHTLDFKIFHQPKDDVYMN